MYSVFLAGTTAALCVGQALAGVAWGGVNIAGFDFGCDILVCGPQQRLSRSINSKDLG